MYTFHLISHDTSDGTINFTVSREGVVLLEAMAQLVLPDAASGGTVELRQFMIYGQGANTLGASAIRAMLGDLLDVYGFDQVVVEGTRRASGARVGRVPKPIRFPHGQDRRLAGR